MKVQCHRLKKQQVFFLPVQLTVTSRTVVSGLFARLSMGQQQPPDTFVERWKPGQGKVQAVLRACWSPVSALGQTQHQLLPWDTGWAVEAAPIDPAAFHPPTGMETGPWLGLQSCSVDRGTATAGPDAEDACHEWVWRGLRAGTAKDHPDMQVCHLHCCPAACAVSGLPWGDTTSRNLPCRAWHLKRKSNF